MTPPKRRWFRYSLRTLFVVVTVLACWVGYQVVWIRARHAMIDRHWQRVELDLAYHVGKVEVFQEEPARVPTAVRILSLLGEKPRNGMLLVFFDDGSGKLNPEDKRELEEARMLFPESLIFWDLAKAR